MRASMRAPHNVIRVSQIAALSEKRKQLKDDVADIDTIVERTRRQAYEDEKRCARL
jgi:hypothetical protein